MSRHPHFGYTRHRKLAVHARTIDHLPGRVNRWLAEKITRGVGTMWCAYLFGCIAVTSLPSTLAEHSVNADVQWVAQTFLQLVLLSVIIVGQNIGAEASDARAAKTFEDTEMILDRLDTSTQGGLADVLKAVDAQRNELAMVAAAVREVLKARDELAVTKMADVPAPAPAPKRGPRKGMLWPRRPSMCRR